METRFDLINEIIKESSGLNNLNAYKNYLNTLTDQALKTKLKDLKEDSQRSHFPKWKSR